MATKKKSFVDSFISNMDEPVINNEVEKVEIIEETVKVPEPIIEKTTQETQITEQVPVETKVTIVSQEISSNYNQEVFNKIEEIRKSIIANETPSLIYKRLKSYDKNINVTLSINRDVARLLDDMVDKIKARKGNLITEILLLGIAEFAKNNEI